MDLVHRAALGTRGFLALAFGCAPGQEVISETERPPVAVEVDAVESGAMVERLANLGPSLHIGVVYVDITADILTSFGAHVRRNGNRVTVRAGKLQRAEYCVEGDYSSASYWFAAAAAAGGTVRLRGLARPTAQGDAGFLDILAAMGCRVSLEGEEIVVSAAGPLRGGTFDCNANPDIVPTLAAIAPLASEPVEITNVANLRVKESDRLAALAMELRRLGATVEERPDSLRIDPGWSSEPVTVETHNDHRIAMAFAIAGLARGGVTIANEQVVAKSYPRFWRTLDEILGARG